MYRGKNTPIRVAIIEDNIYIRHGWELILDNEPAFKVTGSFQCCEDAFVTDIPGNSDIILMDLKLPGMSGIDGIKYLKSRYPDLIILVCTMYEDDINISKAISAGAVGFIPKKTLPMELINAIKNIIRGLSPISPNVAKIILTTSKKPDIKKKFVLSSIEEKILADVALGKSFTAISYEMSFPVETVGSHIRSVYEKIAGK